MCERNAPIRCVVLTLACVWLLPSAEHLFDLLAVRSSSAVRNPSVAQSIDLALQEDVSNGSITIRGLNKKLVSTEQECLDALFQGDAVRSVGEHSLNEHSTRSHCIYTVYLETRSRVESSEKVLVSKLNLVDLAGSERVGKTNSTGVLLTEAKSINKSLSFLEQCVVALSNKQREHVPFRSSLLTHLLKDSLGGNTKTRVICNVHADRGNLDETVSTLKFGTRMRKVTNRIAVNVALDPLMHVAKLQRDVRELKHELQMHDTLANRLGVTYDAYTPEETAQLRKRIEQYTFGGPVADEIEIVNLRQVREAFRIYKQLVLETSAKALLGASPASTQVLSNGLTISAEDAAAAEEAHMVGDIDEDASGGFGLGMVAPERRPVSRPDSRDEPLKPKNILRSRARAAGQNVASAVSTPPIQTNATTTPAGATSTRGPSAGRRAAAAVAANNLPPVTATGSTSYTPKAGRRASFGSNPNGTSIAQEEKVNGVPRVDPTYAVAPRSPTSASQEAAAFDQYRSSGPGYDASELLAAARVESASLRRELRAASVRVNDAKHRIDALASVVEEKRASRASRGEQASEVAVLDEEEYASLQALAAAKSEYKSLYAARQSVEENARAADAAVHESRTDLFDAFAAWFRTEFGVDPSTSADVLSPSQAARLAVAQQEARLAAAQRARQQEEALDPEARLYLQATRSVKPKPIVNGGRRPYVGAAFK